MLTRLLENWPYKLAALVIAIALRVYVSHINDPHTAKQIPIPLTLNGVPDNLVVAEATPSVSLQLSGPSSSLDAITPSSYVAQVDLRGVHPGMNQPLPVLVTPVSGVPQDVVIENQSPRTAVITMENKTRARFAVHAAFQGVAPSGLSYGAPVVIPPIATVVGPESDVSRVTRLIIRGDDAVSGETPAAGMLDGFAAIVALDAQQAPVTRVTVLPGQAEVRIPVTRASATKDLIINASLTGAPTYPAQVSGIDVQPSRLTVAGAPSLLAQTSVASTAPIDISNATSDIVRDVAVDLPAGLTPANKQPATVTVTVHIRQALPPTAQTPAAAPMPTTSAAGAH